MGGLNKNKNDITGDELRSKVANTKFRDNFDRIFGAKTPIKLDAWGDEVPLGEDTRPKDRVKQGLSPSTSIEDWPTGCIANQCDGCVRGTPIINGIHRDSNGGMVCQRGRYATVRE